MTKKEFEPVLYALKAYLEDVDRAIKALEALKETREREGSITPFPMRPSGSAGN